MYHAPANGLTTVFNNTLRNLLKKIINSFTRNWNEKIGEILWAYRKHTEHQPKPPHIRL